MKPTSPVDTLGAALPSPSRTPEAARPPLPGPRGFLPTLRGIIAYDRDPFQFFLDLRAQFGDVMRVWNPGFPLAIVFHPDMVEHVLVKNGRNYTKDAFLRKWKEIFGEGLLTAEGEHWKKERRLMQPTFNRERLETYSAAMQALAAQTYDGWRSGEVRDVSADVMALTLRIVVRTLFGADLEPGVEARVARAFGVCSHYFIYTGQVPGSLMGRFPVPIRLRYVRAVRELDRIIADLVAQRRQRTAAAEGEGDDLLGMLLALRDEDGAAMSDRQLRDEIMTLFLAGHETTALAVVYSLWLFAQRPEAQERAAGGDVAYLKQFMQESLRLYPPAWALMREAAGDDVVGGYHLAAGTNVMIPSWAIHRDPRFYPEPLEFRPERWTPEFAKALPRAAFLPFGYGARMCIGMSFAMSELQILLAEALRRFRFRLVDQGPMRSMGSITMRPKRNVRLAIEARSSS
jgi:cytochrome P450